MSGESSRASNEKRGGVSPKRWVLADLPSFRDAFRRRRAQRFPGLSAGLGKPGPRFLRDPRNMGQIGQKINRRHLSVVPSV